jgi:hypothetical protein
MARKQLDRLRDAVQRKKQESKRASEHPEEGSGAGSELEAEQRGRVERGRPQDTASVPAKSAGKGKKTADKWNQ